MEHVEFATLNWIHWYNEKRIMARLGYRSPMEYEKLYFERVKREESLMVLT